MAPELFQKHPQYSYASDIYAYGIVAWELATREVPIGTIPDEPVIIPEEEKCPKLFQDLFVKCWSKRVEDRPKIAEVVRILDEQVLKEIQSRPSDTSDLGITGTSKLTGGLQEDKCMGIRIEEIGTITGGDELQPFLNYVITGQTKQAEDMLKRDQHIALYSGTITTNGYTFRNITGLQYAMWASDQQMWNMIIQYLPIEVAHQQLKDFNTGWISKHAINVVDLQLLINKLQVYIDLYQVWDNKQKMEYWDKEIVERVNSSVLPMYVRSQLKTPVEITVYSAMEFQKILLSLQHGCLQQQKELECELNYKLGLAYYEKCKYQEAAEWFLKVIDIDVKKLSIKSCLMLWGMYKLGYGEDRTKAESYGQTVSTNIEWIQQEAESGNVWDQVQLGIVYYYSDDAKQRDYAKARLWYEKAAAQHNATAKFYLGEMYHFARGVNVDFKQAEEHYTEAAKMGHADSPAILSLNS